MSQPVGVWRKTSMLALAGGLGFWLANFVISLTPVAAEYRATLSISYIPMLLEALLGGLILASGVSYSLVRFFDRIPTRNPIVKSLQLSFIALVMVTMLIEIPAKLVAPTSDAWRCFVIGVTINALRMTALAVVIGHLHGRLDARATRSLRLS